ncbi:Hpt domain-containing protein [Pseudodesulfovibrio tunisiensis]|uniref:Hpt domain-containing protein n=1 Tax=Pseudodesulfovibrio tunisiensis TaxID=463192 RepID=UPI001FB5375C|nr:Hpt domain-containing protein [Pseudodesulfovibrio tunisiensis]
MTTSETVCVDPELAPIMPRYLELCRANLRTLLDAVRHGDHETVRLLGHKLKGSGASYGLNRISELGAALEIAGREERPGQAGQLAAEAEHYLNTIRIIYE